MISRRTRQQTLTQIDFVSVFTPPPEDEDLDLIDSTDGHRRKRLRLTESTISPRAQAQTSRLRRRRTVRFADDDAPKRPDHAIKRERQATPPRPVKPELPLSPSPRNLRSPVKSESALVSILSDASGNAQPSRKGRGKTNREAGRDGKSVRQAEMRSKHRPALLPTKGRDQGRDVRPHEDEEKLRPEHDHRYSTPRLRRHQKYVPDSEDSENSESEEDAPSRNDRYSVMEEPPPSVPSTVPRGVLRQTSRSYGLEPEPASRQVEERLHAKDLTVANEPLRTQAGSEPPSSSQGKEDLGTQVDGNMARQFASSQGSTTASTCTMSLNRMTPSGLTVRGENHVDPSTASMELPPSLSESQLLPDSLMQSLLPMPPPMTQETATDDEGCNG